MSLQHIQKNSPRLLPKPAKFEKNPPNGYRVIRKTKCRAGGAAGAGGAGSSPIHKQASLAGRLIHFNTQISCGVDVLTSSVSFYFHQVIMLLSTFICPFVCAHERIFLKLFMRVGPHKVSRDYTHHDYKNRITFWILQNPEFSKVPFSMTLAF